MANKGGGKGRTAAGFFLPGLTLAGGVFWLLGVSALISASVRNPWWLLLAVPVAVVGFSIVVWAIEKWVRS